MYMVFFFLLHVINQQLNWGIISFSIAPVINGSMCVCVCDSGAPQAYFGAP